jgi:hypothetical protein
VARLDIHVLGSPILRQETERVEQITPELRRRRSGVANGCASSMPMTCASS